MDVYSVMTMVMTIIVNTLRSSEKSTKMKTEEFFRENLYKISSNIEVIVLIIYFLSEML